MLGPMFSFNDILNISTETSNFADNLRKLNVNVIAIRFELFQLCFWKNSVDFFFFTVSLI